jgi:hypothetical protein
VRRAIFLVPLPRLRSMLTGSEWSAPRNVRVRCEALSHYSPNTIGITLMVLGRPISVREIGRPARRRDPLS